MKILQFIARPHLRSGGPIQMKVLADELALRGHEVWTIYGHDRHSTIDYSADFKQVDQSLVTLKFLEMNGERVNFSNFSSIKELRQIIKNEQFDLIHAHRGNSADFVLFASLGIDIPMLINNGMSTRLKWKNGIKYRNKKTARVIAVAEHVKKILVESGKLNPNKVDVVYGSVDMTKFSPDIKGSLRQQFQIPEQKKIIGYVGSGGGRKGTAELFEAYTELRKTHRDSVLAMVGVTQAALDYHQITIPEDIKDHVLILGFQYDVPTFMADFDIFVFPGTRDEGLTGTVREACAMKIPAISTDVGGNRELIIDKVTGRLIPTRDVPALTESMAYLLDHPELAIKYANKAYEFVYANMSVTARCDKMLRIYTDILS